MQINTLLNIGVILVLVLFVIILMLQVVMRVSPKSKKRLAKNSEQGELYLDQLASAKTFGINTALILLLASRFVFTAHHNVHHKNVPVWLVAGCVVLGIAIGVRTYYQFRK